MTILHFYLYYIRRYLFQLIQLKSAKRLYGDKILRIYHIDESLPAWKNANRISLY